jgi:hypothetical protein
MCASCGQISIAGRRGTGQRNSELLFITIPKIDRELVVSVCILGVVILRMFGKIHNALIVLVLTTNLKSLGVRAVWVQVPLRLPWETKNNQSNKQCRINHRKVVFLFSNFTLPLFPLFASTAYRLHHCVYILLCCPDTATELRWNMGII